MKILLTIFLALAIIGCDWGKSTTVDEALIEYRIVPAIDQFKKDYGRYPTTTEGFSALFHPTVLESDKWNGPYIEGGEIMPLDPWGHPYRYVSRDNGKGGFLIVCTGPDGEISDDDYVYQRKK